MAFTRQSALLSLFVLLGSSFVQDAGGQDPQLDVRRLPAATMESVIGELEYLHQRIDSLEEEPVSLEEVDLSEDVLPPPTHVLARRWFENFDMWGFAAFGFLETGNDGKRPEGGFLVKETTLFIQPQVWDDTVVFFELQINRLAKDDSLAARTGEVHAHFRNVLKCYGDDLLGVKLGRIDIPFGEEYLWQDAINNPLITQTAAYPYGFDEGMLFYGTLLRNYGWIVSLMDGTDQRSFEDHPAKAINAKLYGSPSERLYLSASFMNNGRAAKSAFEFGGSHFQPIGASHFSSVGSSSDDKVDATLYEVDAKLLTDHCGSQIWLSFGQAFLEDLDRAFGREIHWFSVEGIRYLWKDVYAIARYSEIGTYKSDEGYHFDGKITAGGNSAFGYDTKRLQRLSLGLGWKPNPQTVLKLEVGGDWFEVINPSSFTPEDDDRWLAGVEVAVGF